MEERKMEDLLIDYVDGNLTGELKDHVEKTIENKEEWKLEFDRLTKVLQVMGATVELKPDASLKRDFDAMLEQEIDALDDSKVVQMQPTSNKWVSRIAASVALLILGGIIGVLVMNNMENKRELAALRNEMELTKQLVISSLQNQQSASSRLNGVNTSMVMQVSDDEVIAALVNTMNTDENTNVRLAAVSALAQFSEEDQVRSALLAALETQEDPLVMINLINLMVQLKEGRALESLKNLVEKPDVQEVVKEEAHLGIFELS